MSQPAIVQSALGDEPVAARVSLGGEDELFVTPTRTLIYRAEGLLSDEAIEEYRHDTERIEVSEGRRKAKVTLDYGLDGEKTISLPAKKLERALHPILAGVLNAAGVTEPGETVTETFRFSELTLVVTSERLVKHIGEPVWDEDYVEFPYEDVTDLTFEEGNVATSVVLTLDGRQERFKTPNDSSRAVREALQSALLSYYDVESLAELRAVRADDEDESAADEEEEVFGDGPEPLGANPIDLSGEEASGEASEAAGDTPGGTPANGREPVVETDRSAQAETGFEDSGFQAASSVADDGGEIAAELAALREQVEEQNRRIRRQEELVEKLITELRQGR
ncbi:MAG: hypothetical protein ABEJ22_09945 [Haloferacaceae archaeon]